MQSQAELEKVRQDEGNREDANRKLPFFKRVLLSALHIHLLPKNGSATQTKVKIAEPYFHRFSLEAAHDRATVVMMAGPVANVDLLNQFHLR